MFQICVVNGVGIVPLDSCPLNVTISQPCNLQACDFSLWVHNFTVCDDNCGSGHMYQSVSCQDPRGFEQDIDYCALQSGPFTSFYPNQSNPVAVVGGTAELLWPGTISNTSSLIQSCFTQPCNLVR